MSVASVVLLAIPGFKAASQDDILLACLVAGVIASITGMALRWRSHRIEQERAGD